MGWGELPAVPDPERPGRRVERVSIPRGVWAPAAAEAIASLTGRGGVCSHGAVRERCQPCRVEAELRSENDRMRALLLGLVGHETGPCDLDHHGWCRAHGLSGPPCVTAAARGLLGLAPGELPVLDVDEA